MRKSASSLLHGPRPHGIVTSGYIPWGGSTEGGGGGGGGGGGALEPGHALGPSLFPAYVILPPPNMERSLRRYYPRGNEAVKILGEYI